MAHTAAKDTCHEIFCKPIDIVRLLVWNVPIFYTSRQEVLKTEIPKIHEGEYRFCLILWKHEPVTAAQLAKLCLEQLGWKRTTTYTIIKRLGERGILKNENGIVTALVSKDEAQACEIDDLVEKKFEGSLPTFIAAFTKRQDLSEQELDEVQQMIDRIRRGETQ